jgi:hypothetical protein
MGKKGFYHFIVILPKTLPNTPHFPPNLFSQLREAQVTIW